MQASPFTEQSHCFKRVCASWLNWSSESIKEIRGFFARTSLWADSIVLLVVDCVWDCKIFLDFNEINTSRSARTCSSCPYFHVSSLFLLVHAYSLTSKFLWGFIRLDRFKWCPFNWLVIFLIIKIRRWALTSHAYSVLSRFEGSPLFLPTHTYSVSSRFEGSPLFLPTHTYSVSSRF